jgi:hypothetical protein
VPAICVSPLIGELKLFFSYEHYDAISLLTNLRSPKRGGGSWLTRRPRRVSISLHSSPSPETGNYHGTKAFDPKVWFCEFLGPGEQKRGESATLLSRNNENPERRKAPPAIILIVKSCSEKSFAKNRSSPNRKNSSDCSCSWSAERKFVAASKRAYRNEIRLNLLLNRSKTNRQSSICPLYLNRRGKTLLLAKPASACTKAATPRVKIGHGPQRLHGYRFPDPKQSF